MLKLTELCSKLANKLVRNSVSIGHNTLRGHNMPGNDGYYTEDRQSCPDNVRF